MIENGCKERKCPCRMWANCLNYVDIEKQSQRLKKKDYDFCEWYKNNFRGEIHMVDCLVNG